MLKKMREKITAYNNANSSPTSSLYSTSSSSSGTSPDTSHRRKNNSAKNNSANTSLNNLTICTVVFRPPHLCQYATQISIGGIGSSGIFSNEDLEARVEKAWYNLINTQDHAALMQKPIPNRANIFGDENPQKIPFYSHKIQDDTKQGIKGALFSDALIDGVPETLKKIPFNLYRIPHAQK